MPPKRGRDTDPSAAAGSRTASATSRISQAWRSTSASTDRRQHRDPPSRRHRGIIAEYGRVARERTTIQQPQVQTRPVAPCVLVERIAQQGHGSAVSHIKLDSWLGLEITKRPKKAQLDLHGWPPPSIIAKACANTGARMSKPCRTARS